MAGDIINELAFSTISVRLTRPQSALVAAWRAGKYLQYSCVFYYFDAPSSPAERPCDRLPWLQIVLMSLRFPQFLCA